MRKLLTGTVAAAILAVSGGVALANDYVADPPDDNGRCQQVGDQNAGDNDDPGLGTAAGVTDVIRQAANQDECDNSDGRRHGGD